MFICAFAVLISTVLILVITSRTLSPLKTLEKEAISMTKGAYQTRIPLSEGQLKRKDEITTVSESFNRMADAVESHINAVKAFHVHGQTYDKNTKSSYDFPISGSIWYIRDQAFGQYLNYNVRKWIADETAVPADAAGLRMTPVEARKLVEAFWADNGFEDMVVIGVYLTRNSDTGNGGDRKVPDPYGDNSAYVVACGKSIDGILPPPPSSGDPHWAFESCTFTITDNGIETFNWGSPYAYGEYTTKNSALLTFDKVDEIFQKMMLVKYDISGSGNDLTSATYKVDRVTLEMSRVTNRKSSEKGLLVPVWNFYGSYYFTYEDGHNFGSDDREGFPSPLLRINAIDGSIIEPRYGC